MIIADLNDVARIHGGRTIFESLSLSLNEHEKLGLIGPSGGGKSSLMRILAQVEPPEAGNAVFRRGLRIGYLPQEYTGAEGATPIDELLASRDDLNALNARITAVEEQLRDPFVIEHMERFQPALDEHARLLDEYAEAGGPRLRNSAEGLLRDLGLEEEAWRRPMRLLSGGQRKLVGIARCLLAEPDLLLLDEPDNHLDLRRKELLAGVITRFPGCVVVISHDRYLLDDTVTAILELEPHRDGARLQRWEGNYSAYATAREAALLRQQERYAAQQQEIERLEAAVARFKLWASIVVNERHIKQARNKQRQIDRMEKVERPVLERRRMKLELRPKQRGGAKAIELRDVAKSFCDDIILLSADATIMNGERVGIVGANGAGKSILLRIMLGALEADSGVVWVGPSIERGYYAQEHETLDPGQTPVEALRAVRSMYEGEAVAQLGRFLIPYDATSQPIARLSGGEKSRVQLARLMNLGVNCLLLDEPTNNLDIAAAEVLEDSLERFPGTIIVVSHDRYLLDRLVDRVIEVRDGELHQYEGSYSDYAAAITRQAAVAE